MSKMELEAAVPIPPNKRNTKHVWPFEDMRVGDSFYFPGARGTVYNAARAYLDRTGGGRRFTLRREGEGYRCWRVE